VRVRPTARGQQQQQQRRRRQRQGGMCMFRFLYWGGGEGCKDRPASARFHGRAHIKAQVHVNMDVWQ